jgi:hypothetical protein
LSLDPLSPNIFNFLKRFVRNDMLARVGQYGLDVEGRVGCENK